MNQSFPALSNLDIDKYFAANPLLKGKNVKYLGCPRKADFHKKTRSLAAKSNKHAFAVINLDPDGSGTHWVAIWKTAPTLMYYFDSFGVPPDDTILKTLKKSCRPVSKGQVIHNSEQIQNSGSMMCGYYCLAFIDYMLQNPVSLHQGSNFLDFIMLWTDDTAKNDEKMAQLFLKNKKL